MRNKLVSLPVFGLPTSFKMLFHYYLGIKSKLGIAIIDTTFSCNLNCALCYYKRNKIYEENTLDEWESTFKDLKKKGVSFVTWTGGEPLLRKDVIELGKKYFSFNTVFTNGTQPIPNWPDVVFYVSVDGTKEFYEKIRGKHYEEVKKNIAQSLNKVMVAMTINKLNQTCLEEFVAEWLLEKNVLAVTFSLYTRGKDKFDVLGLEDSEADLIVERLRKLKTLHGKRILLSNKVIESFRSDKRTSAVGSDCIVKQFYCLDSKGKAKYPCSMAGSNCESCGQFVPYCFSSIFRGFDVEMIKSFFRCWIKI